MSNQDLTLDADASLDQMFDDLADQIAREIAKDMEAIFGEWCQNRPNGVPPGLTDSISAEFRDQIEQRGQFKARD